MRSFFRVILGITLLLSADANALNYLYAINPGLGLSCADRKDVSGVISVPIVASNWVHQITVWVIGTGGTYVMKQISLPKDTDKFTVTLDTAAYPDGALDLSFSVGSDSQDYAFTMNARNFGAAPTLANPIEVTVRTDDVVVPVPPLPPAPPTPVGCVRRAPSFILFRPCYNQTAVINGETYQVFDTNITNNDSVECGDTYLNYTLNLGSQLEGGTVNGVLTKPGVTRGDAIFVRALPTATEASPSFTLSIGSPYFPIYDATRTGSLYGSGSASGGASSDTQAPSVPTNLAVASTSRGLKLSWNASTDNVGVTGYVVSVDGAAWQTSSSTSVLLKVAAGPHEVRVLATDNAGNYSAQSLPLQINAPAISTSTGGGKKK